MNRAFLAGNGTPMRTAPALFKTPPYVIARPVVTHRKLSFPTDESTANPIRFLVLATDGLWDRLRYADVSLGKYWIYFDSRTATTKWSV